MKKALPTGVMNYQELKTNDYYSVDKTIMIQEFLQRKSKVTLITRPRRFGKTLNMSMLAEFFDITKDSKDIFKDTKIMNTEYAKDMNQYPTIFICFLNAKDNFENTVKYIKEEILREYRRYKFISEKLDDDYHEKFEQIYHDLKSRELDLFPINDAISFLATCLNEYYGKKVMVFIDEYDTPFIEAHIKGFYQEIHADLASLLRTVLKGNDALQYAMLTGIQRVAKENIFSDLNNLDVYTVKDNAYAEYFGFTKEETKKLLEYYDLEYNDKVKEMYDGYRMGDVDIYNPWSIINYAKNKVLTAYWLNTSGNSMIRKAMQQSNAYFKDGYEILIQQGYLETEVNMETSFYEQSETSSLWGLFINAGYLTIEKTIDLENKEYEIRIPNQEVISEFKALTAHYLCVDTRELTELYKSIIKKNKDMFLKSYENLLLVNPSYHDLISENSYQMLLLGICLYIKNDYEIISNREAGKGRCDLILKAKKQTLPSYVIEFKYMKSEVYEKHPEALKQLAQEAIQQIEKQQYDANLNGEIIHVGLAHAQKEIAMEWKAKEL